MIALWKRTVFETAARRLLTRLRRRIVGALAMMGCALGAEPAIAQVQTVIAPVFPAVDAQGVDTVTGAYWTSAAEVVIGRPGEGGLVHGRTWIGSGWRDWLAGTISSSGAKYSVSIGAQTETFTLSGGVYSSDQWVGSTLTYSSGTNKYAYTTSDGTVIVFNKALATAGSTTNFWSSNEGAIESVTQPSGEITSYTYKSATVGGVTGIRPQSITNNLGYQIHFTYAINAPVSASEVTGGYLTRTKATGINRAYYFCADNADACSDATPDKWPYVSYSAAPAAACWTSGTFECVADRLGNKTMYSFVTSARTQMQGLIPPTVAALPTPAVVNQVNYFTSGTHTGKVSGVAVASGGGAWSYTYSDVSGVRTTSVQSGLAVLGITKSDIAAGWVTESWGDVSGNHKTVYHHDAHGRVDRVTTADDDTGAADPYFQYTFDARGNITQVSAVAKPGTRPTITTSAGYDSTCADPRKCNQPNTTTDALGNVTTYSYADASLGHRSLVKVVRPAPVSGAVQPEVRFVYTGKTAYYLNGGSLVAGSTVYRMTGQSACMVGASSGAGCVTSSDETKTTIGYGSTGVPNNLLAASITLASGDGQLSQQTTTTYTKQGDVETVDGPLSAGDVTSYFYDDVRRLRATAANTPSGSSSRIARVSYNADGNPILAEVGIGASASGWQSMSVMQRTSTQYTTYGAPVFNKIEGLTAGSFQTFAVTEQGYDHDLRSSCSALRMNTASYATAAPSVNVCSQWTNGTYGPDRIASPSFNAYNQASQVSSGIGTALQRNDVVRTYTTSGLLSTEADAKGNTTTYTYDGFNRLARIRYPGSSSDCTGTSRDCVDFTYDDYGRLTGKTGRDGLSFAYAYDNLGRMTTYTPPSGQPAVTYTYDNLGRVTQASVATTPTANTTSYVYDALSRLKSETQAGKQVQYDYDVAGRRTKMTWPDGYYVTYEYTDTGELLKIKENGSASVVLATFAYDDLGRRTSLTRANGSTTTYAYDGVSRLTDLDLNLGGTATTNDLQVDLAYNPASQIIGRTVSNTSYLPTVPSVYTDHYTTNALNQYATITGVSPNPTYDKRGNMTNDGTKSYTYDFDNRMLSAGTANLTYDPSGRLYQVGVTGGGTRRFLYDGVDIIAELDATTGNVLRRYVHGPGVDEPLVRYDDYTTNSNVKNQLYADERGSIIATEGASASLSKYDEYGVPAASQSDLFQYTGQVWLSEVGLYYYKARFYNADIGRFMQTDPTGYGDGMNWYSYVRGDPTNVRDPSGLQGECDRDCIVISVCRTGVRCINDPNLTPVFQSGLFYIFFIPRNDGIGGELILQNLGSEPVKDPNKCAAAGYAAYVGGLMTNSLLTGDPFKLDEKNEWGVLGMNFNGTGWFGLAYKGVGRHAPIPGFTRPPSGYSVEIIDVHSHNIGIYASQDDLKGKGGWEGRERKAGPGVSFGGGFVYHKGVGYGGLSGAWNPEGRLPNGKSYYSSATNDSPPCH